MKVARQRSALGLNIESRVRALYIFSCWHSHTFSLSLGAHVALRLHVVVSFIVSADSNFYLTLSVHKLVFV